MGSAEWELVVGIAQGAEKAADHVGPVASGADDAQGGGGLGAPGPDTLEQHALELAAVFRAVRVNAAPTAVERSARLRQVRRAQSRVRIADRQTERPQPRGRIAGLQREVREDDTVAAKPARGAKLFDDCLAGFRSGVQATRKLTPRAAQGNGAGVARERPGDGWANCMEQTACSLEIRRPKTEIRSMTCSDAGIGATSDFGLPSAFGIQVSGFTACPLSYCLACCSLAWS